MSHLAREVVSVDIERVPMSYDDWVALPEKPKAEWVDGVAVIYMAPPLYDHSRSQGRLAFLLMQALPGLDVLPEVEVVLPDNRVRRPDLTVVDHPPTDRGMVRDPAVLVVELLSPSTQSEDLLRKAPEYAAAGIGQYWTVNTDLRRLEVNELVAGGWQLLGVLDERHPDLTVDVGEHGRVALTYDGMFRD